MRSAFPLAILVVAGALLRVAPIADRPVSLDEALTWRTAGEPWADFLMWSHHPDHPPLSFALVRISTYLAGTDAEWALRLPSVVAGTLAIPVAALVGGAFSPAAGVVLAALVAVDPVLVEQARTARMYPLFTLLFLLAIGLVARLAKDDRGSVVWIALGLVLGAAIWTHALGVILWLAVLATVPVARQIRGRLAGALAIAATLAIPGAIALLGGDFGSRGRPEGVEAILGQWRPVAGGLFGLFGFASLGWLLLLAGLAGLVVLARRARVTAALLGAAAALTVVAVLLAASGRPYGIERYLSPVHVAALVGLSALAAWPDVPRLRRVAYAGLAVLVFAFAWQALPRGAPTTHRIGGLARALAPRVTADTPVVFRPAYLRHVGAYYGIRPAVEETDRGRVWIVTQDRRFLRTSGSVALPGEVRRRLPGIAAQRGLEVDLEEIERQLAREHALAIGIDDNGITTLTPGGRTQVVGTRRLSRPARGAGSLQP